MTPPRHSVLFVNRVYPPMRGATGRVLSDLARSFAREGWQVTVITSGPKALTDRDGAVRVMRVKGPDKPAGLLGYGWVWFKMLFLALRLPRTDLLVTMTDPPLLVLAGRIIRKLKRARHIHWCQDLYPDLFPALGVRWPRFIFNFLHRRSRAAMRKADKVIVVGRCMASHLSQDGFDSKQITVIPNWPDLELVQSFEGEGTAEIFRSSDVDGCRNHEQQIKHGPKFRVLYAGNIGLAHPVDTILDAAAILNERHPEIEFVFVGDGPRHDYISRERISRHLDNIRLIPYQPANRLKDLMESGDVHLVSIKDAAAGMIVPVKLYSALAVGRPCILVGPAKSETARVIADFSAGSVIAQGQAEALAEEIRQLRLSSDKWFAAHAGAHAAARIFVPRESINAWLERAQAVVDLDMKAHG